MAKPKRVKVTKNIYGNFRGFKTGELSVELGCIEFDAKLWLCRQVKEGCEVLPSSYF